jgi:5'-methylthioadenosine phosphorylase
MPKIGIIGGSGLYQIPGLTIIEYAKITTPYGAPSDTYVIGDLSGSDIVFLPRHGLEHHLPPHKINYKANIWGFKELEVERLISIGAVGGIGYYTKPGMIMVPDQIIDMTSGRESTFYDGDEVIHIDFTEPYCPELRGSLLRAAENSGIELKKSGTYVCVNGPRLETRAEIKMFLNTGIDIVGMTAMPEAALAREAELCLAGIAVVTNYAAGIAEKRLTTTEVIETMREATTRVGRLLLETFHLISGERGCSCQDALKEARM